MLTGKVIYIPIKLGLPDHIKEYFKKHCVNFELHPCTTSLVQLIMGKAVDFEGDPLLDMNDFKELEGNLSLKLMLLKYLPGKNLRKR